MSSEAGRFTEIICSIPVSGVGLIQFDRAATFNSLNHALEKDVYDAATMFDANRSIGAIVLIGSERAFAAGGDIIEMASRSFSDLDSSSLFEGWDGLAAVRTPLIAAVSGYALGGGCELAMICDIVIAAENAVFGQPEINLGILPGFGGTQRLTRAVGKAKAMDMCLTGRTMDVHEAERAGLVSRIVRTSELLDEALDLATIIATKSKPAAASVKLAVGRAFETSLAEGLRHERALFKGRFATSDQKEGMAAFIEKRHPHFTDR